MRIKLKGALPPIKLPARAQLLLHLIKEDLKANKIRLTLGEISGDGLYNPDLGPMLLAVAGFQEITDDVLNFYCQLIDVGRVNEI